jgi:hypothetical protein
MGCSGSRVDETGRPVINHKTNPEREKKLKTYQEIIPKVRQLVKDFPDILDQNPFEKESFNRFCEEGKQYIEQAKLNQTEFTYGLICEMLIRAEKVYTSSTDVDISGIVSNSVISFMKGIEGDGDLKDRKLKELSNIFHSNGLKNTNAMVFKGNVEIENCKQHYFDIIKYDEKLDAESFVFFIEPEVINDPEFIKAIAEKIEYSTKLTHLALLINPNPESNGESQFANLDCLEPIYKAIETNTRIKSFAMFMRNNCKYSLSEIHQKTIASIFKRNQHLTFSIVPCLPFSDCVMKEMMNTIASHRSLRAVGVDGISYKENHFNWFAEAAQKNKNLKLLCYWGFDTLEQAQQKQKEIGESQDRMVIFNPIRTLN